MHHSQPINTFQNGGQEMNSISPRQSTNPVTLPPTAEAKANGATGTAPSGSEIVGNSAATISAMADFIPAGGLHPVAAGPAEAALHFMADSSHEALVEFGKALETLPDPPPPRTPSPPTGGGGFSGLLHTVSTVMQG
jgi:hypothetical protein